MNTNVILRENVDGLGTIGDVVSVKAGYARNYLLPQGLASVADSRNVKELEHQKRQLSRKLEKVTKDAEGVKRYIDEWVLGTDSHEDFMSKLGGDKRFAELCAQATKR